MVENFSKLELIKRGAEAELFKGTFLQHKVLVKRRTPKNYRHKFLDDKIREERNKKEALLLQRVKSFGVRTPIVYFLDSQDKEIVMEFVEGKRLKDFLNEKNLELCKEFGRIIGKLHRAGVIHGDLTTSNAVVSDENSLVLIDFGLAFDSNKEEDKATDLLNLKKTFTATHFNLMNGFELLLQAYKKESGFAKIEEKIKEIEARARYNY